jgi:wyosine [tRNA(Phe)-imidazoG37] synthetase (radical SAM superfamily)
MELKIDPSEIMIAALAKVFAEANPEALAEAMAVTVLKKNTYNSKTVLEEIVESAVRKLAQEVALQILEEQRDRVVALIRESCDDKMIRVAVSAVEKKLAAL